jgi:hypothetical protein
MKEQIWWSIKEMGLKMKSIASIASYDMIFMDIIPWDLKQKQFF